MTDLSDYLDSEGIEAPDEPPACFAPSWESKPLDECADLDDEEPF